MDAFHHDRHRCSDQREAHAQRCNRFCFAVPVLVIAVWRFDRNLQTEKDDEAAQHISARLQAIRQQSERVTHKSGRTLCNREAKIYQYSEKCGSHASFGDPFRELDSRASCSYPNDFSSICSLF